MSARGGIDLGGTKIQAVVVDEGGAVLGQSRHPTPTTGGPPEVAEAMTEAIREAAEEAGAKAGELEGVGVGSPGVVDDVDGTVSDAGNLPDWEAPFGLRDVLSEDLGVPVSLGNDVQVATNAELALGEPPSHERAWAQGASGEEYVAERLAKYLNHGACVLHDRRIIGSRTNIDHIVIAPSGVWVIDSKRGYRATSQ
jgi:glucokinase